MIFFFRKTSVSLHYQIQTIQKQGGRYEKE